MKVDRYKIKQADSRELIKLIPDKSVDLILIDPPYYLSPYSTGDLELSRHKDINKDLADQDKIEFNPIDFVEKFKRILKPSGNISAFTSFNLIGKWCEALDSKFDTFHYMVWHKTNPLYKIYEGGFLNSCELIIFAWNIGHTWNIISSKEMHNFIETPICSGNERVKNPKHPAQKPLKVLKHIIRIASNPNDLVFDPFMGVGSTGVAALDMKRRFIGFEINEEYFEAAKNRIKITHIYSLLKGTK